MPSNTATISCKSVQPVPAGVEEPVSPVRQSLYLFVFAICYWWCRTIHPFPKYPTTARESRLANWHNLASAYFAAGGEHEQQHCCISTHSFSTHSEEGNRFVPEISTLARGQIFFKIFFSWLFCILLNFEVKHEFAVKFHLVGCPK